MPEMVIRIIYRVILSSIEAYSRNAAKTAPVVIMLIYLNTIQWGVRK